MSAVRTADRGRSAAIAFSAAASGLTTSKANQASLPAARRRCQRTSTRAASGWRRSSQRPSVARKLAYLIHGARASSRPRARTRALSCLKGVRQPKDRAAVVAGRRWDPPQQRARADGSVEVRAAEQHSADARCTPRVRGAAGVDCAARAAAARDTSSSDQRRDRTQKARTWLSHRHWRARDGAKTCRRNARAAQCAAARAPSPTQDGATAAASTPPQRRRRARPTLAHSPKPKTWKPTTRGKRGYGAPQVAARERHEAQAPRLALRDRHSSARVPPIGTRWWAPSRRATRLHGHALDSPLLRSTWRERSRMRRAPWRRTALSIPRSGRAHAPPRRAAGPRGAVPARGSKTKQRPPSRSCRYRPAAILRLKPLGRHGHGLEGSPHARLRKRPPT